MPSERAEVGKSNEVCGGCYGAWEDRGSADLGWQPCVLSLLPAVARVSKCAPNHASIITLISSLSLA